MFVHVLRYLRFRFVLFERKKCLRKKQKCSRQQVMATKTTNMAKLKNQRCVISYDLELTFVSKILFLEQFLQNLNSWFFFKSWTLRKKRANKIEKNFEFSKTFFFRDYFFVWLFLLWISFVHFPFEQRGTEANFVWDGFFAKKWGKKLKTVKIWTYHWF